jgi:hypothetical protein
MNYSNLIPLKKPNLDIVKHKSMLDFANLSDASFTILKSNFN